MRNLSNLGLEEMTEKEMRETKGGISRKAIFGFLSLCWDFIQMKGDSEEYIKVGDYKYYPGRCHCGSECPCCCTCESAWGK